MSGNPDSRQPELAALQAAEARRGSAVLQELASPMVVTPQPHRQSTADSTGTSGSEGYMLPNGKPASVGSQDLASMRAQKGSSVGSLGSQSLDHAASLGELSSMLLGSNMLPARSSIHWKTEWDLHCVSKLANQAVSWSWGGDLH